MQIPVKLAVDTPLQPQSWAAETHLQVEPADDSSLLDSMTVEPQIPVKFIAVLIQYRNLSITLIHVLS